MKIIVGLGNPGKEYELSHHNMGFLCIDELANKLNIKVDKLKFKALLGEGIIDGEKVLLVKPQTFMNASGEAVREIMSFYKASPEELLLIYDDIDLPLGNLRVRKSGSAGSHNGMKSVIYQLQYDNFTRIRIGIGNQGSIPTINYVLMKVSDEEAPKIKAAIIRAAEGAECFIRKGADEVMKIYNTNPKEKVKEEIKDEK